MKVYYVDEIFLLNGLADYLLLRITASVCGRYAPRWRLLCGALAGAAYSVFATAKEGTWTHPALWIAVAVFMIYLAFWPGREGVKLTGVFLLCAFLMGGGAYCLQLLLARPGGRGLRIETLLVLFPVCYGVMKLFLTNISPTHGDGGLAQVQVTVENTNVRFLALLDTGNSLADPVTGKKVLVAELSALGGLNIAKEIQKHRNVATAELLDQMKNTYFARRLRLIPFRSVGEEEGLLLAFRPDEILVNGKKRQDLLVAVSPHPLSDGGAFRAILGV